MCGFCQPFVAVGHVRQALEDGQPVDHRAGGPLVGCQRNAAQHAGLGPPVARQGFQRGQLAHVQVLARAPELALDAAFNKSDQTALHCGACLVTQRKRGVEAAGLVAGRQQIGGEGITAPVGLAISGWEVTGQPVVIEVGGQLRQQGLPQPGVAQAHRLAGFLLQAHKGITGKPVAHAVQAFGQPGLQRQLQAAAAGQGTGGRRHVDFEAAIHLHQRGLLHRQRHGGHDALTGLDAVARRAQCVFGVDLPQDGLEAAQRQLGRCRDHPGHFARFSGRNVHGLPIQAPTLLLCQWDAAP